MNLNYLKDFVAEKCMEHPELKDQIMDYYELALSEIEEGNSVSNEIKAAINSINDLINDN